MRTYDERAWQRVPRPMFLVLGAALLLQIAWHRLQPLPIARPVALPAVPAVSIVRAASLGEPVLAAKLCMLWLQSFDHQPGISLPWRTLDYSRLRDWLALVLTLDPTAQYPLLAASRLYGEVQDPGRSRIMLDFVAESFTADPARRWPWLAHAVFIAQHRLHDQALALRYAQELGAAESAAIPAWARQMQIFVLENMGELESAEVMLGGLLESGQLTDPHERAFLAGRLAELKARSAGVEKRSTSSD